MIESLFQSTGSWSEQLSIGLLVFALRATLILLAAFLVTRVIRGTSAATRHLIWTAAVAGVLVLPLLSAVLPAWNVPVVTIAAKIDAPVEQSLAAERPAAPVAVERGATAAPTSAVPSGVVGEPASLRASWFRGMTTTTFVSSLWLAVASLLLLRLAIANARVSAWRRAASTVEDGRWNALMRRLTRDYGIDRPVVLLQSEDTDVPVTWGVVYPVVLIPGLADEWDEEQRIAVLTHELAHVKRFDALSQMIGQVSLALLWFHPLAWMAVRRMRQEREHACDDFVLAAGARASRYADDLLGLARRLTRPTAPAAAALAMARRSELEGRLLAILDPAIKRGAVEKGRVGMLAVLLVLCVIPLSAFRPAARVTMVSPREEEPVARAGANAPAPQTLPHSAQQTRSATEPNAARDSVRNEMDALIAGLDNLQPALTGLSARTPALSRFLRDTEPVPQGQAQQPVDVSMMIEVARAAKKMTSDYEKGQLLNAIAKRYVRNDSLRDAYLDAVFSMSSDYERSQSLVLLLQRDSIPSYSTAKVLRSAKGMTSDASRGAVLRSISPATFADTAVQRAYMDVITAMTSDFERSQAISALIKSPQLSQSVQLGILRATTAISGNNDKANVLLLFFSKQGLADETVRRAFMKAAETVSSDYDYRRVMTAVMK